MYCAVIYRHVRQGTADAVLPTPFLMTYLYIALVFFGTRLMARRESLQRHTFEWLFIYNLLQVCLNTYMGFQTYYEVARLQGNPTFFTYGGDAERTPVVADAASWSFFPSPPARDTAPMALGSPTLQLLLQWAFFWADTLYQTFTFIPSLVLNRLFAILGWNPRFWTMWLGNGRELSSPWLKVLVWCRWQVHIMELVDTAFVLMRKRYENVLVFHMMVRVIGLWSWFFASWACSYGDIAFVLVLNNLTNGVFYLYLVVTIFKSKILRGDVFRPRKNRMIGLQILQFSVLLLHAGWCLFFGRMPVVACVWQILVQSFMLMTHMDFQAVTAPTLAEHQNAPGALRGSSQSARRDLDQIQRGVAGGGPSLSDTEAEGVLSPRFETVWGGDGELSDPDDPSPVRGGTTSGDRLQSGGLGTREASLPNIRALREQLEELEDFQLRNRKPELMFSFDSCGWLYCYHFGVAYCIETYFGRVNDENLRRYNQKRLDKELREDALLARSNALFGRSPSMSMGGRGPPRPPAEDVESDVDLAEGTGVSGSAEGDRGRSWGTSGRSSQATSGRSSPWDSPPATVRSGATAGATASAPLDRFTSADRLSDSNGSTLSEEVGDGITTKILQQNEFVSSPSCSSSQEELYHAGRGRQQHDIVSNETGEYADSSVTTPLTPHPSLGDDGEFLEELANPACLGYSGSSGGGLVGATLACGINVKGLADYVIEQHAWAGHNPFNALKAMEIALFKWVEHGMDRRASGRLRLLLTKVHVKPPFLMAEICSAYASHSHLHHVLRASSHVPMVAGILPYRITPAMVGFWGGTRG